VARILVLDGHSSAALAFVRSLGRAGHWVSVAAVSGAFAVATQSRYCKAWGCYPNPVKGLESFIEAVSILIDEYEIELVVPMTDATVWPLAQSENLSRQARLAVPTRQAVELVTDKYRTVTLATRLGIPTPNTILVESVDELHEVVSWAYPIVIKDRFSINWKNGMGISGGVTFAYNFDDLCAKVDYRLKSINEVILQNFSPGVGIGFSCFAAGGKIFLPFQWERLREKDPRGSGSSARMSTKLEDDVERLSRSLILHSGFQGICMVEFKKDRKTGALALMEINGRPWGSLQLPIHCGIDYPRHLAEWCLGGSLPAESLPYNENITCRWLTADLIHLENLWEGVPDGWPEPYPNFWVSLIKVLVPWYPGMRGDHFAIDDPKPGIMDLTRWLRIRWGGNAR
jgi:predicted ATP-grasp superfamily ATP-dependent carboligase